MAIRRLTFLLAITLAIDVAASGIAGTVPAYPVAGEPFVVRLTVLTPSQGVRPIRQRASVDGNVIRIDSCYGGGGFATPGSITASVPLPALPPGGYSLEVYRQAGFDDASCDLASSSFAGAYGLIVRARAADYPPPPGPVAPVTRYRNESTGYFFMTANEREQIALESGAFIDWKAVGIEPSSRDEFGFFREPGPGRAPLCRFYSAAFAPKGSHFFSADPAECEAVRRNPLWVEEGIVGYVGVPRPPGVCLEGLVELFRAYNNGRDGAPTHIYTVSRTWYNGLIGGAGWTAEGVAGCVQPL